MAIETAIRELLTGNAGFAALAGTRVYPVMLPQNVTYPAVAYQELRTTTRVPADGDSGERESRFQLAAWAESYAAAKGLGAAIVAAINGHAGGTIERIAVDATRDDVEPETGLWREIVEIVVLWRE